MLDNNDNKNKITFVCCAKNNLILLYNKISGIECTNLTAFLIEKELNLIINIYQDHKSKCYLFEKKRDFHLPIKGNLKTKIKFRDKVYTIDEIFNLVLDKIIEKNNK